MMKRLFILILALITLVGCSNKQVVYVEPEVNSVFYEIYVGSFYDSDGDGMGDLKGVRQKLDYIQYDLGATGVWLMPINPSPTYHKYDVMDYKDIDPQYGTLEDFDALVQEMDERGMDLILDLVLNHSSTQHPWFKEAKEALLNDNCDVTETCDYYNFSYEPVIGYHMLYSNVWYEGGFWDQMPDLNLDNESLREEIVDIAQFWLDKGVDGFRLDATTHFYDDSGEKNIEFLRWFYDEVKTINPNAYVVGEAWTGDLIVHDMYRSGIDSFFNFSGSQNSGYIVKALRSQNGERLAEQVETYNTKLKANNPNGIDAVFLSNHDNNRSAGYLVTLEDQKMAANMYLLMPGNVFIYYGEEVALKGSGIDENKRLPIPWNDKGDNMPKGPENADYTQSEYTYVDKALNDKDSLLNHYQKVIQIRHQYPSISRGTIETVDLGNRALYALEHAGEVLVVHNLGEETIEFDLEHKSIVVVYGEASSKDNTINIKGNSSIVIEK